MKLIFAKPGSSILLGGTRGSELYVHHKWLDLRGAAKHKPTTLCFGVLYECNMFILPVKENMYSSGLK